MKVILIRSNSLVADSRVTREYASLAKNGHQVTLLAWDRENAYPASENKEKNVLIKRLKIPAPYQKHTFLLFLPMFWSWAFIELLLIRPEIVHACDLDTAIPAYAYKVLLCASFVFDLFDRYALAYVPPKRRALYFVVNLIEEALASKADLFITVSEGFLSTFKKFSLKNVAIIRNVPPKIEYVNLVNISDEQYTKQDARTFKLYISHISAESMLASEAIKGLQNVELLITGRAFDHKIKEQVLASNQVTFYGTLQYEQALSIVAAVDVVLILYDPSIQMSQHRLAGCNRLFEAMMFGKPIITNIYDEYVFKRCKTALKYNMIRQV